MSSMSLENPEANNQQPQEMKSEQEVVRTPFSSTEELEKFDAKGFPRKDHFMPNGTIFHGSDEEFTEALQEYHENKN